jgi:prepilin signal peptidase PulO-like enzyme (type II secretory pathway)
MITIPGTTIGLFGAALVPLWLPLTPDLAGPGLLELGASWPDQWPAWLDGHWGLAAGLMILMVWGFALLDRRVILRRGLVKAVTYFFARIYRSRSLMWISLSTTAGLMTLVAAYWMLGGARWNYLLSSLLGMAFAGGMTWAVRVCASQAYGMEALGFGDVTLMAMIGCYIGWQPSLGVFFLAPFLAMLFVLVRYILTRQAATPYGPYLCAAVIVLLIFWDQIWLSRIGPIFLMASDLASPIGDKLGISLSGSDVILGGMAVCVFMIGGMLWVWQLVKRLILGSAQSL